MIVLILQPFVPSQHDCASTSVICPQSVLTVFQLFVPCNYYCASTSAIFPSQYDSASNSTICPHLVLLCQYFSHLPPVSTVPPQLHIYITHPHARLQPPKLHIRHLEVPVLNTLHIRHLEESVLNVDLNTDSSDWRPFFIWSDWRRIDAPSLLSSQFSPKNDSKV
jgi:hypothetical protein